MAQVAESIKSYPKIIDGRFDNPWPTWGGLPKPLDLIRFAFTRKKNTVQSEIERNLKVVKPCFNPPTLQRINATWIGHATVVLQIGKYTLVTDPIFSARCGPNVGGVNFGPRRILPAPCSVEQLPTIDAVLISHNHHDHLDLPTVNALNERFGNSLRWYVPMGLKQWLLNNTTCLNVVERSWWDEDVLTKNSDKVDKVKIIAVPAQHWSTRTVVDKNKSLWCGWVVIDESNPTERFFFSGDTGYCPEFKSIGYHYGPFSLCALPIGCYEPRPFMKNQHVDPFEAIKIHQDVRSMLSFAIHWGTYDMGSTEGLVEPKFELKRQLEGLGLAPDSFVTLNQGETISS